MLACDKAAPSQPLSWDVPEELVDLYGIYMKSNPTSEKLSRLQYLLGIDDSTVATIREMGDGFLNYIVEEEEEEEEFVF